MTGLAVGFASGEETLVCEASDAPGGICSSYYLRAGTSGPEARMHAPPSDGEAYRFEIGGGHWIFGGDPAVLGLIERLVPVRRYARRSSVYFPESGALVPYPIQHHLAHLDEGLAERALAEILAMPSDTPPETMAAWLRQSFGPSLGAHFFEPFHEGYTAGLYPSIAPQDAYKSPIRRDLVLGGAERDTGAEADAVGYNVTFLYPRDGLDALARALAARSRVRYHARATRLDLEANTAHFADGSSVRYERVVSTLPLGTTLRLAGLEVEARPDPHTSVLVLNIGAERGPKCPDDQWLYIPESKSGFHRVGFYDQVDPSFCPASARADGSRASLYIERSFRAGERPSDEDIAQYQREVAAELKAWGFIGAVEVSDPTWIDVAYTWAWPGSRWRAEALGALRQGGVHTVGRYARWVFQGIADSIRDGLVVGAALSGEKA